MHLHKLLENSLSIPCIDTFCNIADGKAADDGFEEIARFITQYEEVERVSLMAGAYDLEVTVKGDNVKDIAMFVYQKLATLSGVLSTATHFVLKTYKEKGIFIETEEKDEREFLIP